MTASEPTAKCELSSLLNCATGQLVGSMRGEAGVLVPGYLRALLGKDVGNWALDVDGQDCKKNLESRRKEMALMI